MSGGENNQAQSDKLIYKVFFYVAGLSTLFVFNCVLSQLKWYEFRFDKKADFEIPFYYNAGSFSAFLVFDQIMKVLKFKHAILGIPPLLVMISVVIFCMGEYINDGQTSKMKYYSMLPLMVFGGFSNSILQTNLIRYTFGFTFVEITAYNSGTALVGVLANLVAMGNAYAIPGVDSKSFTAQAINYLIFQIVTLVLVLLIFIRYNSVVLANQVLSETESISSEKQLGDTIVDVSPSQISNQSFRPEPTLIDTIKIIAPYFFNMILVYTITLAIFPGFCFGLGIGWKNPATFGVAIQVILLSFNIGDFIGKTIYGILPLRDNIVPHLVSLIRIVFVAFIVFVFVGEEPRAQFIDNASVTLIFTFLLALTNGYITSGLFSLSSERAPKDHKGNSGFLMTLGLLFGLTYGGLCATFGSPSMED